MSEPAPLFSFAVIADGHLNPAGAANTSPWRTNRLANARNAFVIRELNRREPAFVVHLGDVVHPVPSHPDYKPAADTALALLAQLQSPLHIVAGNHDVGDKPLDWMPADRITAASLDLFRKTFGADWGAFDHGDCRFVRINASLLNSGLPDEDEQRRWLEAELAAHAGRRIFFFTHYPPYVARVDEASHYDNLNEPARSWLCGLISKYRVEALFAGHVHNFFYNRLGDAHCYVLPSITNLRQDYSELFRIEPADEYGRNDTPKLGFFVVDIYPERHVARFVRTHGATGEEDRAAATDRPPRSRVGVHLRHPWAEEIELPHNAPLDELSRKRVRNDYAVLALWDLGIERLRVPWSDLADARIRDRMADLHALGHRFRVFTFGPPDDTVIETMRAHRALVAQWELVLPLRAVPQAREQLAPHATTLPPVWLAKLSGGGDRPHDASKPFDHSVAVGFDAAELGELEPLKLADGPFRGVVFKIDSDQAFADALARLREGAERLRLTPSICAKLAPTRSAAPPPSDHVIANRVAEVVLHAWAHPGLDLWLDTFQDIDRGYFLRPGLIDRRCNLRLAGEVFRALQAALAPLTPAGPLRHETSAAGASIAFIGKEARGSLWLPDAPQASTSGKLVPLVPPAAADDVEGPWIEIGGAR